MGIWLELGIFGLVFVFAFWQMHDVRKAQELTRQHRAREKATQEAEAALTPSGQATPEPTLKE
jgi:hypothetical protein